MIKIFQCLVILCSCLLCLKGRADELVNLSGHAKYRLHYTRYPDTSIYRRFIDDDAFDQDTDIRLKLAWNKSHWDLSADYQLITLYGDTLEASGQLPPSIPPINEIQNDDQRLFDLTRIVEMRDNRVILHRLDRFYAGYTSEKAVIRFGRQAVSWGNGLIYTPMDFFNPFDPSAVDKEYKTGDDMLYGQYLFNNGHDLQAVVVARRDDQNNISRDVATTTVKYHGFAGNSEYDILMARHYGDDLFGIGGNTSLGGAVWHGDITVTRAVGDTITSLVTGLSYSWVWGTTNYSGTLEYFYNGFGIGDGNYSAVALLQNPALFRRIQRGELYTLGKEYVAASTTIEVTPLWLLTPLVFHSISDGSSLFQLQSQYDLSQNIQLLIAFNIPAGSAGTEFAGIATDIDNLSLAFDYRLYAQIGWYF